MKRKNPVLDGIIERWASAGVGVKVLLATFFLGTCLACQHPVVSPKNTQIKPVDLIQLDLRIEGVNEVERQGLISIIGKRIALPVESADLKKWSTIQPSSVPAGVANILQIRIKGNQNYYEGIGMGKAALKNMGVGAGSFALLGSGAIFHVFYWQGAAIGAGVGAMLGVATTPWDYNHSKEIKKKYGYLPLSFDLSARMVDLSATHDNTKIITTWTPIYILSHMHPIDDPSATKEDIHQENMRAFIESLIDHIHGNLGIPIASDDVQLAPSMPQPSPNLGY